MSEEINYGKNNKRIIFTDTDHRHAQLTLKLKDDGMTQAKFFRSIITGYLSDDDRIRSYVVDSGDLSKYKKQRNWKTGNSRFGFIRGSSRQYLRSNIGGVSGIMRGDGLLPCSRECLKKKKKCPQVQCKHFIHYEDEYNCSLISIHKNGRMTLREVGDRLRISFARVKQIESAALKKIKNTDLFSFKDMG